MRGYGYWAYSTGGPWIGHFGSEDETISYCVDVLGLTIGHFVTGQKGIEF